MTMRASPTESTGTTGQSEVRAAFSRIGWGPVDNPQHDLGTDLWVAVRDERGFDLGLMVGAQVKAGPSWFEEPFLEGGECRAARRRSRCLESGRRQTSSSATSSRPLQTNCGSPT